MLDGVMHWNVASWRIAAAAKLAVLERNGMSNLHVDAATRPLAAAWPLLAANAVCECARLPTAGGLALLMFAHAGCGLLIGAAFLLS